MRKAIMVPLVLMILVMGLTNVACDKEEKAIKKTENVAPTIGDVKVPKAQRTDALSGKAVNKNIFTDHKGNRIYFCCDQSKQDFQKDPERYLAIFRSQGVILEVTPTK